MNPPIMKIMLSECHLNADKHTYDGLDYYCRVGLALNPPAVAAHSAIRTKNVPFHGSLWRCFKYAPAKVWSEHNFQMSMK